MPNPQLNELVDYIKKARAAGQPDQQTRQVLLKNGWSDAETDEAFVAVPAEKPQPQAQVQTKPQSQPQQSNSQPQQKPQQPVQIQPQSQQQSQQPVQPKTAAVQPQTQPQQTQAQPQVSAQPTIQAQQPQVQPVTNKKFRAGGGRHFGLKLSLFLIIIILAISAGGAVWVLATGIWNPGWNPFRPSPESVISKAWNNLKEIKSENFNVEFLLNGKGVKTYGSGSDFNVSVTANGGADIEEKLALVKMDLEASENDSIGNKVEFSLAGEGRLIEKAFYLKIDKLNIGQFAFFLQMFGIDISKIKGQWIKFDQADTQNSIQQYSGIKTDQQTQAQKDAQEELDKVVKVLLDKKVYDIKQLSDSQDSEGKEYHYIVSLNRQRLNDALPEIYSISEEYSKKIAENTGRTYVSERSLDEVTKEVNDDLDKIGDLSIELFISKSDNFFRKVQLVKNGIDLSKFNDKNSGILDVSYVAEQSGINQPIQVQVPTDYKSFQDIMGEIGGPQLKKQMISSNVQKISSIARSYFSANGNYADLCKGGYLNGDLENFGPQLVDVSKSIVNQKVRRLVCFSNAKNYCASAQLQDHTWVCVSGNSFVTGKTQCVSASTVCK